MLTDMTESLNQKPEEQGEKHSFVQRIIQDFDHVAYCLVEMLKDPSNFILFQKT